jgi:ATP-dependent Clp protease ATP-binding subunit ClpX
MKFGMIPEFVGRLPVLTHVESMDEPTLVRILTEPKNALVRQYQKLFQMDSVQLELDEEALHAVAKATLKLKTGARGLRTILEGVLLDIMYEIPSHPEIARVLITPEVIVEGASPLVFDHANNQLPLELELAA